jgi:hypothetical protein
MLENPSQWFVYDGKEVTGPFPASYLSTLEQSSQKPAAKQPLLVSRKGLTRWYPVQEFSDLTKQIEDLERPIATGLETLTQTLNESIDAINTQKPAVADETFASSAVENVAPVASETQNKAAPQPTTQAAKVILQNLYDLNSASATIVLKGRLRLGELRKLSHVFLLSIVSIGLYMPIWMRSFYRELNWHVNNDLSIEGMPNFFVSCVPGYHVSVFFRLAKFLRYAEEQNFYQKTSPRLAAVLAIVPPLAMVYLQYRANLHWRFHMHAKA